MASSDGCATPDPCESILGEVSATCDDESQGSRGGDGLTRPVHQRRLNFIYTNSFCFIHLRALPGRPCLTRQAAPGPICLTLSAGEDGDIGLGVNISRLCSYPPFTLL